MQVGDDLHADEKLAEVTRLAPGEPAAWANWGVLALRQRSFDAAAQRLERARKLAGDDARIYALLGNLESQRGNSPQAIAHLRKATDLDPHDLRGLYALAREIERQGGERSDAEFQSVLERILTQQPDNLAAWLELGRIAAKRGDMTTLKQAATRLGTRASDWPPEVREQLAALNAAIEGGDSRAVANRIVVLRNALMRVPEYRQSYSRIRAPPGEDVAALKGFMRMEAPRFNPAPADTALAFDYQPLTGAVNGRWNWLGAIQLDGTGSPVVAVANGERLLLATGAAIAYPGGPAHTPPTPEGVLQIDFDYDFKTDLVLAGAGGVRLFHQDDAKTFVDVTPQAKLSNAVRAGRYAGAWAADIDADGDLDIVLGSASGPPVVLRNNGDGTFTDIRPFPGVDGLRQWVWLDLDGDGTPDAAVIDGGGRLHVFINERQGEFRERALPATLPAIKAIAVADLDSAPMLALVAVQADGAIVRISANDRQTFDVREVARVPDPAKSLANDVRLRVGDLDNNGATDLVLAPLAATGGPLIWLGTDKNALVPLAAAATPALVLAVADIDGNGKLDLLGLDANGAPVRGANRGSKSYHWQVVRPRAAQAFGDQRINPFAIGGEVEIRAGMLAQKQPIAGPQVHFGLGEQTTADVIRVIWPNGSVRAEFDVKADQTVVTEQRLKGSCPFLFAFDGKHMRFVKDAVPWGSAIGLRINTLGSADIAATEEWYKIARNDLAARDGYYDLRITAELWEVYYYDYLALTTVDHPAGTEIFVDERFVIPPAKLAITAVSTPHKIARATDDIGNDVTDIVSALDGRAVDSFGHGQYQGVTRDHYLEVDLGDDAPARGPLYLIAHGSLYPTDSSINVAMSQGNRWRAHSLSLEVQDAHGRWVTARDNLGFPAGRKKTMLIDLTDVVPGGAPRRVRLRTNLEIYWDAIEWAAGAPATPLQTTRLAPAVADLHYRGYSVIERKSAGAPEVPDYARISGTSQRWRDLVGYYTRFGDVRELLARIDDRYVIMNSGDEMSLRFEAPPPPAEGWVRDFVIMGDGWIKDGDYNSTFSKTVQPLPYHARKSYTVPPGRLEDERVYQQYPDDWQTYHTRYVTPDVFVNALRVRSP